MIRTLPGVAMDLEAKRPVRRAAAPSAKSQHSLSSMLAEPAIGHRSA